MMFALIETLLCVATVLLFSGYELPGAVVAGASLVAQVLDIYLKRRSPRR